MGEARKMAAILAADVAGFSRLAGEDEDRTLARLRALRSDLIDPIFASHSGRIVKRMGDGILAEFHSVINAVRCAMDLQTAMLERNEGVPSERRITFRIGIHLGDIVEESDGDIMGDGVNIAARLEGVAKVGGICLSEDAYRHVRSRLEVAVSDMGLIKLKNIAEPIRIYALDVALPPGRSSGPAPPTSWGTRAAVSRGVRLALILALATVAAGGAWLFTTSKPQSAAPAPAAPAHLSIVVLPFTNMSNDPTQDYFADGVTENLTTVLSRIQNSFVIARNTAFAFKGKAVDARVIGRDLGVRYVLEGSVQREQDTVRINVDLIDAASGAHLWADRLEENVSGLFKLEDQVVAQLANSLGYQLIKAEAEKAALAKSPDVLDLVMRGWALTWRTKQIPLRADCEAALDLFDRALAIDPNEASALAGEASIRFVQYSFGWGGEGVDHDLEILGKADRAIALAPEETRAYLVKSEYLSASGRAAKGLEIADAGLVIGPNDAHLLAARGFAEISLGQFEQAKRDFEPALLLSPRDLALAQWRLSLGLADVGLGQYGPASEQFQGAIKFGNQTFVPYGYLAAALALDGKMDQAAAALASARGLNPRLTAARLLSIGPPVPNLREGLRKAGLTDG